MDRRHFLAAASGTAAALALGARASDAAGETCRFVAVSPTRLIDTRDNDTSPPLGPRTYVGLQITGRADIFVPTTARAVVLNVTLTQAQAAGYVSAFPWGADATGTSILNVTYVGQTVAVLATVQLSASGGVQLFTLAGAHLIADIFGYYEPTGSSASGRFQPVYQAPYRMLDTRDGAGAFAPRETRLYRPPTSGPGAVPAGASAVVVNVTIANAGGPGFWTLWGSGTLPLVSNLNTMYWGHVVANQAIVPLAPNGTFNVFSLSGGDLILDVAGYYTGAGDGGDPRNGLFVPLTPQRLLDTREGGELNPLVDAYQWRARKPHSGWTVEVPVLGRAGVPGSGVSAVALSLTLTSSEGPGFVTAYPARTNLPLASNVNTSTPGNTVANHAIMPITVYGFSLYDFGGAHLVADINGYFTGPPTTAYTAKVRNPSTPGMWFPTALYIPRLNSRLMTCYPDTSDASLANGPGHLTGTMFPGAPGNCAVFGHRTSHTAPFYYLDRMQWGDVVQFSSWQGVATYNVYQVDQWVLPSEPSLYYMGSDIPTLTLIACMPLHSTTWRIVARCVLVDYVEN